MTNIIRKEKTV